MFTMSKHQQPFQLGLLQLVHILVHILASSSDVMADARDACHGCGTSCIATARTVWEPCAQCGIMPPGGVHKETRLCPEHFIAQREAEGSPVCYCVKVQALLFEKSSTMCHGNGTTCWHYAKKSHIACSTCAVWMPQGVHAGTHLCPNCFHAHCVERGMVSCICGSTEAAKVVCTNLQEEMARIKGRGRGELAVSGCSSWNASSTRLDMLQPPPPPNTSPPLVRVQIPPPPNTPPNTPPRSVRQQLPPTEAAKVVCTKRQEEMGKVTGEFAVSGCSSWNASPTSPMQSAGGSSRLGKGTGEFAVSGCSSWNARPTSPMQSAGGSSRSAEDMLQEVLAQLKELNLKVTEIQATLKKLGEVEV